MTSIAEQAAAEQIGQYALDMRNVLGEGNSSCVVLGTDTTSGEKVAVKIFNKSLLSERSKTLLEQEIRALRRLPPHPNIIKLVEVIDRDDLRYVVHEYIEEGDLFEYMMKNQDRLNERACRLFFVQIVKAVYFLHRSGVVHHDIKLENVGLRKGATSVVLMDFGYCCEFTTEPLSKFCGTLCYCAPELLLGKPYSATPVDVWSLGVVLFVLVCKRFPFDADNLETLYKQASSREYIRSLLVSSQVSEDAQDLLQKIFVPAPERRISASEILRHRFLKGVDEELISPDT
jgi:serine/threonine protein kinase